MCGPEEMIFYVKDALQTLGVSDDKIKFELFTTPVLLAEKKKLRFLNLQELPRLK